MASIDIECPWCDGTGLYQGMCEPEGVAVVCLQCKGTGCEQFRYKPFTKRKGKRGIKKVYQSRGNFILTGVGPEGEGVTYGEFKRGKMP